MMGVPHDPGNLSVYTVPINTVRQPCLHNAMTVERNDNFADTNCIVGPEAKKNSTDIQNRYLTPFTLKCIVNIRS